MISNNHAHKICSQFALGDYISATQIERGVLNVNYHFVTSKGDFFVKSVRAKSQQELPHIYRVESFMQQQGIPAITMLADVNGQIVCPIEERVYTVYPFVKGVHHNQYSDQDFYEAGVMLGRIHALSIDKNKTIDVPDFMRPNDEKLHQTLLEFQELIRNKKDKDETDVKFEKLISIKLKAQNIVPDVVLQNNAIIHGDFHMGNILLKSDSPEIIGICDWEKTEYAPAMYELARSVFTISEFGILEESASLHIAKQLLRGYSSIVPIDPEIFMMGMQMRLRRNVFAKWLEVKYYRDKDSRANHFIESDCKLIEMFVFGDCLEKVRAIVASLK